MSSFRVDKNYYSLLFELYIPRSYLNETFRKAWLNAALKVFNSVTNQLSDPQNNEFVTNVFLFIPSHMIPCTEFLETVSYHRWGKRNLSAKNLRQCDKWLRRYCDEAVSQWHLVLDYVVTCCCEMKSRIHNEISRYVHNGLSVAWTWVFFFVEVNSTLRVQNTQIITAVKVLNQSSIAVMSSAND